jgi:hypothetical protein
VPEARNLVNTYLCTVSTWGLTFLLFLIHLSAMCDPLIKNAIDAFGPLDMAALKLKVSKSHLYMILRGDRKPSKKLLRDLGLSRVEFITRAS